VAVLIDPATNDCITTNAVILSERSESKDLQLFLLRRINPGAISICMFTVQMGI